MNKKLLKNKKKKICTELISQHIYSPSTSSGCSSHSTSVMASPAPTDLQRPHTNLTVDFSSYDKRPADNTSQTMLSSIWDFNFALSNNQSTNSVVIAISWTQL
jgi:hypothetical protein